MTYVESVAIVELLDERFPAPRLLPGDAHARARVRALVEMVNSGIQPFQNLGVLKHVSSNPEVQKAWAQHFIGKGLRAFEAAMQTHEREGTAGPYAYGDAPTMADVFLVPQVLGAKRFKVDARQCPRVGRAFDAAMKLEAFQRAAPERRPRRRGHVKRVRMRASVRRGRSRSSSACYWPRRLHGRRPSSRGVRRPTGPFTRAGEHIAARSRPPPPLVRP